MISLANYLEASARRFPELPAVVDPDGSIVTYQELDEQAASLAGFLKARGVGRGDRVALLLPKSARTVAAIFGILKAGAAYVPVDCTAPAARVYSIFTDCRVRALFTDANGLGKLEAAPAEAIPEYIIAGSSAEPAGSAIAWDEALSFEPLPAGANPSAPADLAYILYTSGSTGVPKGVMLSQENATSFVDWCSSVFLPTEEDRFSSHAPFHFDLSILDIYISLKHGASLHIVSEELGKNPRELAEFIAQRQLTIWYSTPSILALLAQFGHLENLDCQSLRTVLFAGEVFPVRHLRHITQLWPHPKYFNLYGPTETNVCTFAGVPSVIPEGRSEPYPIGPACAHCMPLVLDPDLQPVASGEEGLLYISGPSVFQGYWNRPKETAAAFIEHDGRRWYCTGDVVHEDPQQGFVYVGRRDRMVKRRGYRIELGDIEAALYRDKQLREVAVISSTAGGGDVKIIAYLVGGERKPSVIEMKMFCARNLQAYMNPDQFIFVNSLPRTSTNKVDYQALGRQFEQEAALTTV